MSFNKETSDIYEYVKNMPALTESEKAEAKAIEESKPRAQRAYEYWKIFRWSTSLRKVAEKFDISHVALIHYRDKVEGRVSNRTRKLTQSGRLDVKILHDNRCYVCWKTFNPDDLEIDHWNGDRTDDSWGNLVPLCNQCHRRKTNKWPNKRSVAVIRRFWPEPMSEIREEETT